MVLRTGKLQLTYVGEIMASGGWDPKMDHLVCFLPGTLALGAANGAAPAGVALESHPDMVLAKVRPASCAPPCASSACSTWYFFVCSCFVRLSSAADDGVGLRVQELMRTCYEGYQAMAAKLAPEIWRFKITVRQPPLSPSVAASSSSTLRINRCRGRARPALAMTSWSRSATRTTSYGPFPPLCPRSVSSSGSVSSAGVAAAQAGDGGESARDVQPDGRSDVPGVGLEYLLQVRGAHQGPDRR